MNSVLLTGATGTLGRQVLRILAESEHDVRALSRSPHLAAATGTRWVIGDLAKNLGLDPAVDSVQTVMAQATSQLPRT